MMLELLDGFEWTLECVVVDDSEVLVALAGSMVAYAM